MAFFGNKLTSVVIPNSVVMLAGTVFADNQLTSVTIPESITDISGWTFRNNRLAGVVLPRGLTHIGDRAFDNNRLTSIVIPDKVTSVETGAFANNPITSITIGRNVELATISNNSSSFPSNFDTYYEAAGKRAGTYTLKDGKWSTPGWTPPANLEMPHYSEK
jgi:hypothetical protein